MLLDRRSFLKVGAVIALTDKKHKKKKPIKPVCPAPVIPVVPTTISSTPPQVNTMTQPNIITVPPLAGIGVNAPIQIPSTDSGSATLVNLSNVYSLVLCNDSNFTSTWPLVAGVSEPFPDLGSPFIQNPNAFPVNVLVLDGISALSFNPSSNLQGGRSKADSTIAQNSNATPLPALATGYYKLQRINIYSAFTPNTSAGLAVVWDQGLADPIFSSDTPTGGYCDAQENLDGLLCTGPIEFVLNGGGVGARFILRYDVVS